MTTLPVLTYFNKDTDHIIQTGASMSGFSGVLLQEGQTIVYASRTLTDTECRYSNLERELLGVVFGLKDCTTIYLGNLSQLRLTTSCS